MIARRLVLSTCALLAVLTVDCFAQRPPRVVAAPRLNYPPIAWWARIQGTVTLRVRLSDDGRVKNAELVRTTVNTRESQEQVLSTAALDSVNKWQFEPTGAKAPTIREFEMQYVFKLVGRPSHEYRSRMKVNRRFTVEIISPPPRPILDFSEVRSTK